MSAELKRSPPLVQVVAAVITAADGKFLLARRPAGKVYAGYWEFPGGKIEPGEPHEAALARELHEELGIDVRRAFPWLIQRFLYPHAHVQLNFYRVTHWLGEPHPREDQVLSWTSIDDLRVGPILPANGPILRALALPTRLGITNAAQVGVDCFLARLDRALTGGLRFLMIREPGMAQSDSRPFAREVMRRCRPYRTKVVVHADHGDTTAADGLHFSSRQLQRLAARPSAGLCGVSCHDAGELHRAVELGFDYALLGPVLPTPTHPGSEGVSFDTVARLLAEPMLPVYLIGGMHDGLMEQAWQCGAHGIAMIRHAWDAA